MREDLLAIAMAGQVSPGVDGLLSTYAYKQLSPQEKSKICNGAGAARQTISIFIPNTLWGLDCEECFNIHDYDYWDGVTESEREHRDNRLEKNLHIRINKAAYLLRFVRKRRAAKYLYFVRKYGGEAFHQWHRGVFVGELE